MHFTLQLAPVVDIWFNIRLVSIYRKVPKFSDTRNFCCKLPKIQTKRQNPRVFHQKHANGIANSEDPDQMAPSDLDLDCLPRPICPKI